MSDYKVLVHPARTSVQTLTTSRRRVQTLSVTRIIVTLLALTSVLGGVVFATASAFLTSEHAKANVIADMVCAEDELKLGGHVSQSLFGEVVLPKNVSDAATQGVRAKSWGATNAPEHITAYEKYGVEFPIYQAWKPAYSTKEYKFKGVAPGATGYAGDFPSGAEIELPKSSALTTHVPLNCLNIAGSASALIANVVSTPARFLVQASISIHTIANQQGIAQKGSILHPLGEKVDEIITERGGLRDSLFVPFMMPLIVIGAIGVGYLGIVKRAFSASISSVVWMVAAIASGTLFLTQPTMLAGLADKVVATATTAGTDIVTAASNTPEMCNLPATAPQKALREMQCGIWFAMVYTPWVSGQFNTSPTVSADDSSKETVLTADPRGFLAASTVEYGSKGGVTAKSWPQLQLDRQVVSDRQVEISEVAFAQLSGESSFGTNLGWGGVQNAIPSVMLMTAGAVGITIPMFIYGGATVVYQLMMLALIFLAPLFFLAGIEPRWGRRVLLRFAEMFVSITLKRILTSLVLAVVLLFFGIFMSLVAPFIIKLILVVCLAFFSIKMRSQVISSFSNINFGGDSRIGLPGGRLATNTATVAGGVLAGLGGAAVARHIFKKGEQDGADLAPANSKSSGAVAVKTAKTVGSAAKTGAKLYNQTAGAAGGGATSAVPTSAPTVTPEPTPAPVAQDAPAPQAPAAPTPASTPPKRPTKPASQGNMDVAPRVSPQRRPQKEQTVGEVAKETVTDPDVGSAAVHAVVSVTPAAPAAGVASGATKTALEMKQGGDARKGKS